MIQMIPAIQSVVASISGSTQEKSSTNTPNSPNSLGDCEELKTVSNVLDAKRAEEALPGSWKLGFEITKEDQYKICEIVRLYNTNHPMKFYLKPCDTYKPGGKTEVIRDLHGIERHSFGTRSCFEDAFNCAKRRIKKLPTAHTKKERERATKPETAEAQPQPSGRPTTAHNEKARPASAATPSSERKRKQATAGAD